MVNKLNSNKLCLSCEVFPPKKDGMIEGIVRTLKQLEAIKYIRDNNKFQDMTVRLQSICILREMYPELLCARYKLSVLPSYEESDNYDLLQLIGRKRGFLISGGEIDTERTANMLIDEFRSSKIGRITLDKRMD